METRSRLEELKQKTKVKNTRQELIHKFNQIGLSISLSSFLDVHYSQELAGRIYHKLDEIESSEQIPDFEMVFQKLLEMQSLYSNKNESVVALYPYESMNAGAINLKLSEFWDHLEKILEVIYFNTGNNHLLIVDQALEFGICAVAYEDYFTITNW